MSQRIQAGVLSFTIYVSIIISILLLMLIMYTYYTNIEKAHYRIGVRLLDNLSSAEQWALSEGDQLGYGQEVVMDLFGEGKDSVGVTRKQWGLYDLYAVRSFFQHHSKQSKFLAGKRLSGPGTSSLYLQDQSRSLQLVGDTRIEGEVYVPRGQVSPAYINRVGYTGDQLVYGTIYQSGKDLPPIEATEQLAQFKSQIDAVPHVAHTSESDLINHSFWSDSLMVLEVEDYTVSESLTGYVLIQSSGTVVMERSAHTEHVVVMAGQIHFEKDFSGQGQFFATDTIIVKENVELLYPSVLYLDNPSSPALIDIKSSARVSGTIILTGSEDHYADRLLAIEDDAVVNGTIYCNGYLTTFGEQNGHVFTRKFLINSFSGIYENYVMNATFRNDLDSGFLVPTSWFLSNKNGVLQWLY